MKVGKKVLAASFVFFQIVFSEIVFAHGGGHGGSNPPPPPPQVPPPQGADAPPAPPPGPSRPSTPGGAYGGPGDTVGGGTGPTTGAPTGPTTGAPKGPLGGAKGTATGAGFVVVDDLDIWEVWWKYNQHSFLNLRKAIYEEGVTTGTNEKKNPGEEFRPTEEELKGKVVPALLKVLHEGKNPHLNSGLVVALGKIGREPKLSSELAHYLSDANQEMAETSAFCLGLIKDERALPTLLALAQDLPMGRSFVGKAVVPQRTRAFAIYGLGILGSDVKDMKVRRRIVEELRKVSTKDGVETGVAKMIALGLVQDEDCTAAEDLRRTLDDKTLDAMVRAHVPVALGRLLHGSDPKLKHPLYPVIFQRLLATIEDRGEVEFVRASAIQSIWMFVESGTPNAKSALEVLTKAMKEARTPTERNFAAISIGKIGGLEAEQILSNQFAKKSLRPWLAIGMGICSLSDRETVSRCAPLIREAFNTEGNPSNLGAYAITLGLMKDLSAEKMLLDRIKAGGQDELRGYCSVGLGLMRSRSSVKTLQEVARNATNRPDLLKQAAIGLVLLGDKTIATELVTSLSKSKLLAMQTALGMAIGWIGDRRCIDPLLELLDGDKMSPLAKAFVAVALGMIGDREPVHWSVKIATDVNYFAAPSTLFDRAAFGGILDIM